MLITQTTTKSTTKQAYVKDVRNLSFLSTKTKAAKNPLYLRVFLLNSIIKFLYLRLCFLVFFHSGGNLAD
jgi:hypothetical protein